MEGQGVGDWVDVTLSVDDSYLGEIERVADDLRGQGMQIEHVLRTIGTVSGRIPLAKVDELRSVQGVSNVERAREVQLAPPEDDVQ